MEQQSSFFLQMSSFALPDIAENSSGWGPVSVPEEFEGMPFLPFGKNDKLNRIADWTAPSHQGRKCLLLF